MRAVEPDIEGLLDRDGVKVGYAAYGRAFAARGTLVLAPAWLVVDSRMWKAQVPFLSRHFQVVTVQPRGNGPSDRPTDPAAYAETLIAGDLIAAMDAVGADRAVIVGLSLGAWYGALAAAAHPDRVAGLFALGPSLLGLDEPEPGPSAFDVERDSYHGWQRYNRHAWRADWRGFLEFFFSQAFTEPHSTKQREDCVEWGLATTPEQVIADYDAPRGATDAAGVARVLGAIRCPVQVVHGDRDEISPVERGRAMAELTGGELLVVEGGGHILAARQPVSVNRWIAAFADRAFGGPVAPARWTRPLDRPPRALYLSSPIGLGHARRDLAIVRELRKLRPDVRVDWLAQHPVTAVLDAAGETVHPAAALLASEAAHWESEADEHDLHAFQALRRMDEILAANFMLFDDVVAAGDYDLVVADEAWELDYFLHENPETKRYAYAWMTDFVGFVPMGDEDAALTADYNAEMLTQVSRFPRVRDRALYVGDPGDIVPDDFGPGLPNIRDWTAAHYGFTGYITGIDPASVADRDALRAEFGWAPDERVCVVTVGGTGVGAPLLRRAIEAWPLAASLVPGLRMVVVTGPRIDPASLPPGPEFHAYLPDLHRRLAACDLAVVQGGLTTTMELVAAGRPFVYVPLRNHFEQQRHVTHRLARYGAGRRLDYSDVTPESLAEVIRDEIGREVAYRPVASDGAARAASELSGLL